MVDYDIVIVGGGPAGMTAAIYASRNGASNLIIEKSGLGGQIVSSPKVENIPGFVSISGMQFAELMSQQLNPDDIVWDEVVRIDRDYLAQEWIVCTEESCYRCHCVILATGVEHRLLPIDGIEKYVGNGISFCAVCDGDFYKDKDVIVVGGGNSALQETILLSKIVNHVLVLQDLDHLTGEASLIDEIASLSNVDIVYNYHVDSITKENGLMIINHNLSADGIFLAIGLVPDNNKFDNVVHLDDSGYIDGSQFGPSIFAAGDCRKKNYRQVVTACSDGAEAALKACEYIRKVESKS